MNPENNRFMFGCLLLIIIAVFGGLIITGRVNENSSYGLHEILGILGVIGGAFMNAWLGGRFVDVGLVKPPTEVTTEVKK